MQLSQIFTGLIAGGVLLTVAWWAQSKILRLVAVLVTTNFVISGLGISRNVGLVMLVTVAIAWLGISLYFKYKPRGIEFDKEFMHDLKARVKVREALIAKEMSAIVPVPAVVPATFEIVDLIELTEEEKVANFEKEAALTERNTEAFLKKRAAERKRKQAEAEDAAELARQEQAAKKAKDLPPPPPKLMTHAEKNAALLALLDKKDADVKIFTDRGLSEDSNEISIVLDGYARAVKALRDTPTSK